MSPCWALRGFRWSYCAFIAAASLIAAQSALQGHAEGAHGAHFVLILAAAETIAALTLILEPAELIAGAALLLIYAIAGAISIVSKLSAAKIAAWIVAKHPPVPPGLTHRTDALAGAETAIRARVNVIEPTNVRGIQPP